MAANEPKILSIVSKEGCANLSGTERDESVIEESREF
jgi:hypothetical protein